VSYLTSGLIACLLTLVVLLIHLRARMAFRGFPPRHGGTAMALALATVWSLALVLPIGTSRMPAQGLYPILVGAVIVFLVGWIDDMRPLPPLIKLLGQIAGASASYAVGVRVGFLESGVLNYGLTAFCLVGGAHAMNLIDGLDGLAAGISAIAAGTFFFIAHDVGQVEAAVLSVSLAGASLAFLWLNLPPARVFMGDSGSNLLGFGLGAVPLLLSSGGDGFENFSVGVLVLPPASGADCSRAAHHSRATGTTSTIASLPRAGP
jgi:UDP-GlcNAc:undecaprenyl-phosphate GlcNAc-1-phosphate transferase